MDQGSLCIRRNSLGQHRARLELDRLLTTYPRGPVWVRICAPTSRSSVRVLVLRVSGL